MRRFLDVSFHRRSGRARRRCRGDRGAALAEFAIVVPLLGLLVAGTIEFGTAWRDSLTVTSSTRASARVVSNLGDERLADFEGLLSLAAGLSTIDGITIEGVLVFEASAADGSPDPSCFDANGDPVASAVGNCNYYTGAQLETLSASAFTSAGGGATCASTAPDWEFCPLTERETTLGAGLTKVGVWVRIHRSWFTSMFPGDGVTITDRTVMNVEPEG